MEWYKILESWKIIQNSLARQSKHDFSETLRKTTKSQTYPSGGDLLARKSRSAPSACQACFVCKVPWLNSWPSQRHQTSLSLSEMWVGRPYVASTSQRQVKTFKKEMNLQIARRKTACAVFPLESDANTPGAPKKEKAKNQHWRRRKSSVTQKGQISTVPEPSSVGKDGKAAFKPHIYRVTTAIDIHRPEFQPRLCCCIQSCTTAWKAGCEQNSWIAAWHPTHHYDMWRRRFCEIRDHPGKSQRHTFCHAHFKKRTFCTFCYKKMGSLYMGSTMIKWFAPVGSNQTSCKSGACLIKVGNKSKPSENYEAFELLHESSWWQIQHLSLLASCSKLASTRCSAL